MEEQNQKRKKSFNLVLVVFAVILIGVLAILILLIIKNNSEEKIEESVKNVVPQLSVNDINSTHNKVENLYDFENINTSSNNTVDLSNYNQASNNTQAENVIQTNTTNSTVANNTNEQNDSSKRKITLNDHTFNFDKSKDVSVIQSGNVAALQVKDSQNNYQILCYTDSSTSFETLKTKSPLKDYLEKTYKLTITSNLKTGKADNSDIILTTISDSNKVAYLLITPLSSSEIAYFKISNLSDASNLLEDLSKPMDEISLILANIES